MCYLIKWPYIAGFATSWIPKKIMLLSGRNFSTLNLNLNLNANYLVLFNY